MKKLCLWGLMAWFSLVSSVNSANAAQVSLEDWIFNIDGATHEAFFGDPLPTTGSLVDGLGTLSLEITGSGSHNIIGYFDYEIFETSNTFFNESGAVTGTPETGQSWEIDEPGFIFGDIIDNAITGSLDNSVAVSPGNEEDVAFAIGWDFSLLANDTAFIDFVITDMLPSVDFFLTQMDPDLGESIYFYSTLDVQGSGFLPGSSVDVPEPSTWYLMLAGLLCLFLSRNYKIDYVRLLLGVRGK